MEPIQGEGGYVVPDADVPPAPPGDLRPARDPAHRRRGPVGRRPDGEDVGDRALRAWSPTSSSTAKGIASGMPIGAMIAKAEIMSWGPGAHGSTYGGNPVALAALMETMALLEEGLIANAAERGDQALPGPAAAPASAPGARPRRPRQGPDDRGPVRLRRHGRRRPDAEAFQRGLLVLEAATTASGCRRRSS